MSDVVVQDTNRVRTIAMARPQTRNAIDEKMAGDLAAAFEAFDGDADVDIAILTGSGGTFCSGADLVEVAGSHPGDRVRPTGSSPLGPARMRLSKPVIAATEGFAVAGGLELAVWCDLRVAARNAVLGVFCRRFGVPLVDMGTIRLPRLIGHSRAMDLILTGREVSGAEAHGVGLVNRLVEPGQALNVAQQLAEELTSVPQTCLRNDRLSVIQQWALTGEEAIRNEARLGLATIASGETRRGAHLFGNGLGRHGSKLDET